MRKFFTILLFIGLNYLTTAQTVFNVVQSPQYIMPCDSNCAWIKATLPKPQLTTSYTVNAVSYAPTTFAGGTTLPMYDDSFSHSIPIGFPFCFYGNAYSQCAVSDNGVLTFNTTVYANFICNNNTQQTLPYFNSTFADNAIFFPFMDLDPLQGGVVKYATVGVAPFRKFIVKFENFKLFGVTCSNTLSSFQVELSETSNMIEIFIANKTTCDADTTKKSNYATIGIQRQNALQALTVPNRHAAIWAASNEAWQFAPNGGQAHTINWYSEFNNNALIASNVDSVKVCPPYYPFKVWATYNLPCPNTSLKDTVTIIKQDPYIDSIVNINPLCNNDSTGQITVYGNGFNAPIQYSFMGGAFSFNNHWTGLPVGTYSITLKDSIGCEKVIGVTLHPSNNPQIVLDSLINPDCPNPNGHIHVHIVNGTPPYTITWSNGDTGTVADSLAGGILTAYVTDANGCYISYSFLIQWDSLPSATFQITKPICGDSSGIINTFPNNGTPPYTYAWSTGDTGSTVLNVHPGFYFLTITDSNGCARNLTINIIDTLNLITDSFKTNTSCGASNAMALVVPQNGLAPYSHVWSNGSTNDTISNLAAGTYWCITTDANGCKEIDSFFVAVSPMINNVISKANSNCDSNNGKIFTLPSGFTPPLAYLWSTGSTSTSLTSLAAGTYWVKITDWFGCTRTDTIQLAEDGKPKLIIDSYTPPTCYGDSNGTVTLSGLNGTAPYKYSLDGILFSSIAQVDSVGGGNYLIYIRDANGCTNDTTVYFSQPDSMGVIYTSDTLICYYDKNAGIILHPFGGTSPITYSFDGMPFGLDSVFANYSIGVYPLVIRDAHYCLDTFGIAVKGPAEPLDISIKKQDVSCLDTSNGYIVATGDGGWGSYSYLWENNDSSQIRDKLKWGTYKIIVEDEKGCVANKLVQINQLHCCNVVVPNAFTPNNDNLNEIIKPIVISEVEEFVFTIVDRYGKVVFNTSTINEGWNGRNIKGKEYEMGTYFYFLKYKCSFDDEVHLLKGDITLYR